MIVSPDNKQIKKVISLCERGKTRREEGLFVIEGTRTFLETPEDEIVQAFTRESFTADVEVAEKLNRIPYETVSDAVFKKMSDTVNGQGILAIVKQRQYRLQDLIKPDGLYLVLETIQDPGNLGTIMRTAEGAGVTAVILSRDTVDLYSPKVVRATMGAIFRQPFVVTEDVRETVKSLKQAGIRCFAAHLKGTGSYWEEDYRPGTAFLIGNEGNGLTEETAALADRYVKIPMEGKLESLNAAVSAALLSYEAKRQRTVLKGLLGMIAAGMMLTGVVLPARADNASDILQNANAGAGVVLDTKAYNDESTESLGIETTETEESDEFGSDLVMATVKTALNVRSEPNLDSEILGRIYKDCGGKVLERGEEWSYIETGALVGWASNEFLCFDEEAEEMARDVGFVNAVVTDTAVYVRKGPLTEAPYYGILSYNASAEVIDDSDDTWVKIAYGDYDGYVLKSSVKITFTVDHGETMEQIKEREAAEEAARLEALKQKMAMQSTENLERLLGALIQCEAGGEPYEGMLAVGAVVMNRVNSGAYPSTVYDVIFASGQFTPAQTGALQRVYNAGPKAICVQAAKEALAGKSNVGTLTHFRRKGNREGLIIGNHVFY